MAAAIKFVFLVMLFIALVCNADMVGVEVEDVEYVESDADEFVSHIETAVSEVAPFRGTVV